MKRSATLVALMALSACVEAPVTAEPEPGTDECHASAMQDLVGQDRSVLDTMRFGVPVRIIGPGQAVTMDYIATRMNIEYGENGRITRVSCG